MFLLREKTARLEAARLMSPLIYTLATELPLHFEPRYLTTGAWVLVLPFAYYLDKAINLKQKGASCAV